MVVEASSTVGRYVDLPKYEVLAGKVYAMSPRPSTSHVRTARNVSEIFSRYLKGKPLASIFKNWIFFRG